MGRYIRYCQICQHRKHTKMEGITCKRGLSEFSGRCDRFIEDEITHEEMLMQSINERDRFANALTAIQYTIVIVMMALMTGAYFGEYKIGHFASYFMGVILIGVSGAAGAWGIDRYFKIKGARESDKDLTLDGIAKHIIDKGFIPRISNDAVSFKIEGKEYVIRDFGDGKYIIHTDYKDIPQELTVKAQTAAYEAAYETYMAKIVIFKLSTSILKHAEISVQFLCKSEKSFKENIDMYIAYIDGAYNLFCDKLRS